MLQAEEIHQNWNTFLSIIEDHITGERKDKLLEFYKRSWCNGSTWVYPRDSTLTDPGEKM